MDDDKYSLKGLTQEEKEEKLIRLTDEDWLHTPRSERLLLMQYVENEQSNAKLSSIKKLIIIIIVLFICLIGCRQ